MRLGESIAVTIAGSWGIVYNLDYIVRVIQSEVVSESVATPVVETVPVVVSWSDVVVKSMLFEVPVTVSELIYAEPVVLISIGESLPVSVNYSDIVGFVDEFVISVVSGEIIDVSRLVEFSTREYERVAVIASEDIIRNVYAREYVSPSIVMSESVAYGFNYSTVIAIGESIVVSKGTSIGIGEALASVLSLVEEITRGDTYRVSVASSENLSMSIQKVHVLQVPEANPVTISASF